MHPQIRFADWIESRLWVVARTMPEWPHEYTSRSIKKDPPEITEAFNWAVLYIREKGVRRRFLPSGSRFTYLDFGPYSYFSMGWPVHQTILVNRFRIDPDWPNHRLVKRRIPKASKAPMGTET